MSVGSKLLQLALVAVVSLAVVVTFARSTPVGLTDEVLQAVLVTEQTAPAQPSCPCPTEIENADCDDGVCPTGLVQHAADQTRAFAPPAYGMSAQDRLGLNRAPDPMPPRRLV